MDNTLLISDDQLPLLITLDESYFISTTTGDSSLPEMVHQLLTTGEYNA